MDMGYRARRRRRRSGPSTTAAVLAGSQNNDTHTEDFKMISTLRFPRVLVAAAAVSVLGLMAMPRPAAAVVVCKTVGVPKGCVAAAPAAVVVAPVVRPVVAPRVYHPVARVGVRRRI